MIARTVMKLFLEQFVAEFVELKNRHSQEEAAEHEDDGLTLVRETQYCTRQAEALSAMSEPRRSLGAAETGRSLAAPYQFADAEPLAWKRVENHSAMKGLLGNTLRAKWTEATTGPPRALFELLEGSDEQFRQRLIKAQGLCQELRPLLEARNKILGAACNESVKAAEELSKDYRLNPEDGVLGRRVFITRAHIWVSVLPTTIVPAECSEEPQEGLTWRRYAFERAHMTFLEPHRPAGATYQALKRIAFWPSIYKDFSVWLNSCAVCHQYRTVGVMAPMRSTLQSIEEYAKKHGLT